MAGTTFEKYGGFSTVSRVVMTFYEHVLDSDVVGHYFDDVDMAKQVDHQTKFISSLMGGPAAISDERLRVVHHKLNINNEEFKEIARLLSGAMAEHGMSELDISDVIKAVESKRELIVKRAHG